MKAWLHQKLWLPILDQLKQGISPEKIALTITFAVALGIFPILGSTMLLCGLAAWRFKLNQPIIQAVNYVVYPLQLLLLIPFYRLGERLWGAAPVPIVISELIARFQQDPKQFFIDYGMVGVYGVTAWALVVPLLAWLGYQLALKLLPKR
jgi:uncharacterized protein (DUF2062 family)